MLYSIVAYMNKCIGILTRLSTIAPTYRHNKVRGRDHQGYIHYQQEKWADDVASVKVR